MSSYRAAGATHDRTPATATVIDNKFLMLSGGGRVAEHVFG